MYNYAINVPDLTTVMDEIGIKVLLAPVIQHKYPMEPGSSNIDEFGVILESEDDQAEAIIQIVRDKFPYIRFYKRGGRGGWNRISKVRRMQQNPKPKKKKVNLEKALKKARAGTSVIIQPGSRKEYNELMKKLKKEKLEYVVLKKDVKENIIPGLGLATASLLLTFAIPAVLVVGAGYLVYKGYQHAKKKGADEALAPLATSTVVPPEP